MAVLILIFCLIMFWSELSAMFKNFLMLFAMFVVGLMAISDGVAVCQRKGMKLYKVHWKYLFLGKQEVKREVMSLCQTTNYLLHFQVQVEK